MSKKFGEAGSPKLEVVSSDVSKEMIICLDNDGTPFLQIEGLRYNINTTAV